MENRNSISLVKVIIRLLLTGTSTPAIVQYLKDNNFRSPHNKPYTELMVNAEINRLRHQSGNYTSTLFQSLMLCITTKELSLSEVSKALYTPRKKVAV